MTSPNACFCILVAWIQGKSFFYVSYPSVMLKWIQEQYECQVYALTIDIGFLDSLPANVPGQTSDDLPAIREKAIKLGAKEAIVYDAKEEFANDLLAQAIKANADYQGGYALGCPLGRVIISKVTMIQANI